MGDIGIGVCETCIYKKTCKYRKKIKGVETKLKCEGRWQWQSGEFRGVEWHIVVDSCNFYERGKIK